MRKTDRLFQLFSGPTAGAYFVTLTITLGWSANRAYLTHFGIDPSGVDGTSAETTVNYIGFGLVVLHKYLYLIKWIVIYSLIWFVGYDLIYRLIKTYWPQKSYLLELIWTSVTIGIMTFFALVSFIDGREVAKNIGKDIAKQYLKTPYLYFQQIKINPDSLLPKIESDGCWRKILQDKKNLYAYFDEKDGNTRIFIYVIPLDKITFYKISPEGDCPSIARTPAS